MNSRNVSRAILKKGICALIGSILCSNAFASVQNGGFESGTGTTPAVWIPFGNVFREQVVPRTGTSSLKMYGGFTGAANTSGAYQIVPVVAGQRISAVSWAYNRSSDAISGGNTAWLKIIYRNAGGFDLGFSESRILTSATTQNQWQKISASLGNAPIGTTQCAVFLLFNQPSSTPFASGAAIFDDVSVVVSSGSAYKLAWSDEFSGTSLNTKVWEPMIGDGSAYGIPGWGNNELQYYTDRSKNLSVSDGTLRIIADRENFGGKSYTSARIRTRPGGVGDILYGRIEARMKVPVGQGIWSAFWMLPTSSPYGVWASSGEIDIMELINNTDQLLTTIHYGGAWPNNIQSGFTTNRTSGFGDGFHNYAVEWEPDSITWFVDGVQVYTRNSTQWYSSGALWNQRAPFDTAFYTLINLAVGGNLPGSPNSRTNFPAVLQVDWVRYSQLDRSRKSLSNAQ